MSEPDTGIYNALNKGVRDAKGEWFYVLGCDDYICHPEVMDRLIVEAGDADIVSTTVQEEGVGTQCYRRVNLNATLWHTPYCHQGVIMRTPLISRYGAFDEKYRIAADYKLLLKCHIDGCRVSYREDGGSVFASFGMRGMSESNQDLMNHEFDLVLAECFSLKMDRIRFYRSRGFLPFRTFIRFLFASDRGLRTSSWNMFRIWLRLKIRLVLYPIVVITRPIRQRKQKDASL